MLQCIKSTNDPEICYFFITDKISFQPDEIAVRAGFGPRVVVWRPLLYCSGFLTSVLLKWGYTYLLGYAKALQRETNFFHNEILTQRNNDHRYVLSKPKRSLKLIQRSLKYIRNSLYCNNENTLKPCFMTISVFRSNTGGSLSNVFAISKVK